MDSMGLQSGETVSRARCGVVIALALIFVGIRSGPAVAATDAEVCESLKLLAAGKYSFCLLKSESKARKKGQDADTSRCLSSLVKGFAKAEAKGRGSCASGLTLEEVTDSSGKYSSGVVAGLSGRTRQDPPGHEDPPETCPVSPDGQVAPGPLMNLSRDEIGIVRSVSMDALRAAEINPDEERVYLTAVRFYRDKTAQRTGDCDRRAVASHYRYDGNATLQTAVNVTQGTTEGEVVWTGFPTPLAPEEIALAEQLALEDPAIRDVLAPFLSPDGGGEPNYELQVLVNTPDGQSPLAGQRIASLLFLGPNGYIDFGGLVQVNLTLEAAAITRGER